MNQAATDLEGFSRWLSKLFRAGVATGWTVTQRGAGANMSVDIAPGDGVPMTTDTAPWDWSTATKNVSVGAASANNRRDLVVAYTDLSVTNPSTSTPNNPGALKFIVVQGTPATSPSDPNNAAIRATAVGATNPYLILARVSLTSSTTQITNAQITSLITPIALNVQRLWGGSNNTLGHLLPNQGDGTLVTTTDVGSIASAMIAAGAVTPAKMSAIKLSGVGGSYTASPPAANGAFLMQAGSNVVTFASNSAAITFPTAFPNGLLMAIAVQGDNTSGTGVGYNVAAISNATTLSLNCTVNGASRVNWLAIGW
jgi:hypothetical protein